MEEKSNDKAHKFVFHVNLNHEQKVQVTAFQTHSKTVLKISGVQLDLHKITEILDLQLGFLRLNADKKYNSTWKLLVLFQAFLSCKFDRELKRLLNSYLDGISQNLVGRLVIFLNEETHNAKYSACFRAGLIGLIFEEKKGFPDSYRIRDTFRDLNFEDQKLSGTEYVLPHVKSEKPVLVKLGMSPKFFHNTDCLSKYSKIYFCLKDQSIHTFRDKKCTKRYPLDKLYFVFLALMRLMINNLEQIRSNSIVWVAILGAIFTRFDEQQISTKMILDDIDGFEYLMQVKLSANCSNYLLRLFQCMLSMQDAKASICLKFADSHQMLFECYETCVLTVPYWESELTKSVVDIYELPSGTKDSKVIYQVLEAIKQLIDKNEKDPKKISYLVTFYIAIIRVSYSIIGPEFIDDQISKEGLVSKLTKSINETSHFEWFSQIERVINCVATYPRENYHFWMGTLKTAILMYYRFQEQLFRVDGKFDTYQANYSKINEYWYEIQITSNQVVHVFAFCPKSNERLHVRLRQTGSKSVEPMTSLKNDHFQEILNTIYDRLMQSSSFNFVTVLIEVTLVLWLFWKTPMSRDNSVLNKALNGLNAAVTYNLQQNENAKEGSQMTEMKDLMLHHSTELAASVGDLSQEAYVEGIHAMHDLILNKIRDIHFENIPTSSSSKGSNRQDKHFYLTSQSDGSYSIQVKTPMDEISVEFDYLIQFTSHGMTVKINGLGQTNEQISSHKRVFSWYLWTILDEDPTLEEIQNVISAIYVLTIYEILQEKEKTDEIPGSNFLYENRGSYLAILVLNDRDMNLTEVVPKMSIHMFRETAVTFEFMLSYFKRLAFESRASNASPCFLALCNLLKLQLQLVSQQSDAQSSV
ncbi:hypothetical protein Ciccas_001082 [Cichlidogyrus casuarinus]|uniref:Uncharacterized protein n=1 Tax=Cichlidogyrus casuarinus TaxID=1844966 RepID=A0ABD2QL36_9PLAT